MYDRVGFISMNDVNNLINTVSCVREWKHIPQMLNKFHSISFFPNMSRQIDKYFQNISFLYYNHFFTCPYNGIFPSL